MAGKRRFGRIRALPSGRWQARYKGPDGIDRAAPHTFARKTDAEVWLVKAEAEIRDDLWLNPEDGKVAFGDYARAWVKERPNLRPHTVAVYRYMFRRHLDPFFGNRAVADIKEGHVRRWRKEQLDSGASATSIAKAYRLLKAILNTAVDDGLIRRNPCRIKGAGQDRSPERSGLTVRQVVGLADAIDPRYRALVLLAVFGSLRWGELAALRRCDIDLRTNTITVARSLTELSGGGYHYGPPKSEAGKRRVVYPASIQPQLKAHLQRFVSAGEDTLVFTSPTGAPLRHSNFRRRYWLPALAKAGLSGMHFHDLRHTGNTFTAGAGATLREMMDRMGHSSTRAALIYMHGSDARQRALAVSLNKLAQAELNRSDGRARSGSPRTRTGTQRARKAGHSG
jgi:integrase